MINPQKFAIWVCLALGGITHGGPFQVPPIAASDPRIQLWANRVIDYSPASGFQSNGNPWQALRAADGNTVSLGERNQAELDAGLTPGSITVRFARAMYNGPGWDFSVFENAFGLAPDANFGELGYVEVSTDGAHFARFPAISLTTERVDVGFGSAFSGIDPTNVRNLAGQFVTGTGAPFDLRELASHPEVQSGRVNLDWIRFVRIVDIPGSSSFDNPLRATNGEVAFSDILGNPILDAWDTTPTGTAGFDLDAIGVRYAQRQFPLPADPMAESAGGTAAAIPEPSPAVFFAWLAMAITAFGRDRRNGQNESNGPIMTAALQRARRSTIGTRHSGWRQIRPID